MDIKDVWLTVECPECNVALQSHYVHEIRTCKCGKLTVEGGNPCFDDKQPLKGFKVVRHSKYEDIDLQPFYLGRISYTKCSIKSQKPSNKASTIQSRTSETKVKPKLE
jgi:hypothetical protein